MTDPVALVIAWLTAHTPLHTLTAGRISAVFDPSDGYPAIGIGSVSGGPLSIPSRMVDGVEEWQVALFVYAGRLNGGESDQPDTVAAWACAQAVVEAAAAITDTHYTSSSGTRIVAAAITSAVPGVDPDTNDARAVVTMTLTVFA